MRRIFGTLGGLIGIGLGLNGCAWFASPPPEPARPPAVTQVSEAGERAVQALLAVRFDERLRELGREHLQHRILLSLPERLETMKRRGRAATVAEFDAARDLLELALAYNQQLLAPDDRQARVAGETRVRELLGCEAEFAAERFMAAQRRVAILDAAAARPGFPESGERLRRQSREALAEAAIGIRTLLGMTPGEPVALRRGERPELGPLPAGDLETALRRRPELADSPYDPAALAAATQRLMALLPPQAVSGRPDERLLWCTAQLLRYPRQHAERRLLEQSLPGELRFLLLALGVANELQSDRAELAAAERALAALPPADDYEHLLAREAAELRLRQALYRLRCDLSLARPAAERREYAAADWDQTVALAVKLLENQ